ncbi:hypothetical protein HK102_009072 [Quaeritorhiza haematococci]|nr:hypothetical protein HK102_009072 [Quaeritorhiza haematococci]
MIARTGAGPAPIPFKKLNSTNLAEALKFTLTPDAREKATGLGALLRSEPSGAEAGVASFHRHLPLSQMVCDVDPTQLARLYSTQYDMKLSPAAAKVLVDAGHLDPKSLHPYRSMFWETSNPSLVAYNSTGQNGLYTAVTPFVDSLTAVTGDATLGIYKFFEETGKGIAKAGTKAKNAQEATVMVATGFGKGLGKTVYYTMKSGGRFIGKMGQAMHATAAVVNEEKPQNKRVVRNVGEGVWQGSASFGKSLVAGVSDFFVKPYQGALESGVKGGMKGFGQGTTSLLLKPMAGTLDLVYLSGKGAALSVKKAARKSFSKSSKKEESEASVPSTNGGSSPSSSTTSTLQAGQDQSSLPSYQDAIAISNDKTFHLRPPKGSEEDAGHAARLTNLVLGSDDELHRLGDRAPSSTTDANVNRHGEESTSVLKKLVHPETGEVLGFMMDAPGSTVDGGNVDQKEGSDASAVTVTSVTTSSGATQTLIARPLSADVSAATPTPDTSNGQQESPATTAEDEVAANGNGEVGREEVAATLVSEEVGQEKRASILARFVEFVEWRKTNV